MTINFKVGDRIRNNKEEVSKGGRVMMKMMENTKMEMINSWEKCKGTWTRIEGGKKSVLD